jgi:hypothetical protein
VAQVVEHLPNKSEAPSSNPRMAKKKKKNKKKTKNRIREGKERLH